MNTNDYRIAPGGEGPHAATWKDKPHRLIYDLCREIERLTGTPSPANGGWSSEWPTTPGRYWCHGYPFGTNKPRQEPMLALCEVKEVGNPLWLNYQIHGAIVFERNAGPTRFTPAIVPTPPEAL